MDLLYTKRLVTDNPLVELLDQDGDVLLTVPADAADQILSHLNGPARAYAIAASEWKSADTGVPVTVYEIVADDDHSEVIYSSDDLLNVTALFGVLDRG